MTRGFTLIELVISIALATLVMAALANLGAPLARAQARGLRAQTAQIDSSSMFLWADKRLREASWVGVPAASGAAADRLEGCGNADRTGPGGEFEPLDRAQPMTWFALCTGGGALQRHEGQGCPPAYRCGDGALDSFRGGPGGTATARFSRPFPLSSSVTAEFSASSGGESSSVTTTVSVGPSGAARLREEAP